MGGRDAEDDALLAAGRHAELLAAYYPVILQRTLVRLPETDAWDVAHQAVERLMNELARGKTYSVPFRVVVHSVIDWKVKEHWGRRRSDPLESDPPDLDDPIADAETAIDLVRLLASLPPRERQVLELRYLKGLEIVQIAAELGMTRNAVDQALFRGRGRLRELLGG